MTRRFGASLAVALCLSAGAMTQEAGDFVSREISRFSAGIVCSPPSSERVAAPDTTAGYVDIVENYPPFSTASRQVPAILGVSFGVRYQSKVRDFIDAELIVTHPPMLDGGATTQRWQTDIWADRETGSYFGFDFDYELVEGPWTIEAQVDGEVVFRAHFDVVAPDVVPELTTLCGFADLLS